MNTKIQYQSVDEPEKDQTESSKVKDRFKGRSQTLKYGDDGQQIRLIYIPIWTGLLNHLVLTKWMVGTYKPWLLSEAQCI